MRKSIVKSLLFEAYRRNDMADTRERSKPLTCRWLGLGTEAAYRPILKAGLMIFHDGRTPPPRCMRWLILTSAGIEELKKHEFEFSRVIARLKAETNYSKTYWANYTLAGGLSRS